MRFSIISALALTCNAEILVPIDQTFTTVCTSDAQCTTNAEDCCAAFWVMDSDGEASSTFKRCMTQSQRLNYPVKMRNNGNPTALTYGEYYSWACIEVPDGQS